MGFQLPGRMVSRQLIGRLPPAFADGRAGGHALQAVAVERAAPFVRVGVPIVGQGNVAKLRMHQAVRQPAIDQPTATDARADGQVDEGVQPLRRAPAPLPQPGNVDVGVEADGRTQPATNGPGQIGAGPAGLGRAGDVAEGRRVRVGVQRAKGGNAHRGHGAVVGLLLAEEGQGAADGFVGCRRREARLGAHVVRPRAHGANELRPPCLNPTHICVVHVMLSQEAHAKALRGKGAKSRVACLSSWRPWLLSAFA